MPESISSCGLLRRPHTAPPRDARWTTRAATAVLEFDADRAVAVEHHPGRGGFGEHCQVLPLAARLEVCVRGAPPGAPALVDRVSQKPSGSADPMLDGMAAFLHGGQPRRGGLRGLR